MNRQPVLQLLLQRTQKLLSYPLARAGLIVGLLLVLTGIALGINLPAKDIPKSGEPLVMPLSLPSAEEIAPVQADTTVDEIPATGEPDQHWQDVVVAPGETLDAIFRAQGFSAGLLHQVVNLHPATRDLARIHPGQVFQFARNEDGGFKRMRVALDETRRISVTLTPEGLEFSEELRQVERRTAMASGVIQDSLFLAGRRAGLSDKMIMKLAGIFGWDIDFVLDIRKDDKFYLVYEQLYREGEFLRDGEILAASFVNQGDHYRAIRYSTDQGDDYYTPDGLSMRKTFLRAPLNFSYISSRFNPKRFHPILKRVKAHHGIDYRAPKGTPVYAAGDGKVIRSAYSKYNGNHVFIQHGNNVVTKYLHFTKRKVKQGQRVKQGQVIGFVGATGLAQAPHLHYEFVVNGVHRNPRTVNLPQADPLPKQALAEFKIATESLLEQLALLEGPQLFAASGQ